MLWAELSRERQITCHWHSVCPPAAAAAQSNASSFEIDWDLTNLFGPLKTIHVSKASSLEIHWDVKYHAFSVNSLLRLCLSFNPFLKSNLILSPQNMYNLVSRNHSNIEKSDLALKN